MKISKATIDRTVGIAGAVAAPVLAILIRHHILTAADATDIGTATASAVVAYHGGTYVQRRKGTPEVADLP